MTRPSDPFVLYSSTYENSRERFRRQHDHIRRFWPRAQLVQQPVGDGLTIDWISGKARKNNDKLLVLTCGEHGAEGIVGVAVLQVFFEASLTMMDADHTGVLLVHAINPWGMKHGRRTNAANVDLTGTLSMMSN